MGSTDDRAIACTLTGAAHADRVAWIARLNGDGLRTWQRGLTSLELHYTVGVRDRVRELVREESECCAFLAFAVHESADAVRLTIAVPDRARDMADELLEPFLPTGNTIGGEIGDGWVNSTIATK
jgi:hypothetical protein